MRIHKGIRRLSVCAFAVALGIAQMTAVAAPPVVMKVLVLAGNTSETSYQSITSYLAQIGVPYQAEVLSSITPIPRAIVYLKWLYSIPSLARACTKASF